MFTTVSTLISVLFLFVSIFFRCSFATLYEGDKCSLNDGRGGTCKLIKDCPYAIQLLKTRVNPVLCGFEGIQSIVCCKIEDKANQTNNATYTTQTSQLLKRTESTQVPHQVTAADRTPGDITKQKCKEYAQYAYEEVLAPTLTITPQYVKTLECDLHRVRLDVGSSVASRREFPHMALIGFNVNNDVQWLCGGSLISENFVLTAAHCLRTKHEGPAVLVRVGVTNKMDLSHMQDRAVSEKIHHPKYSPPVKYNDIGLLKLSKNVEFNIYVRPACLYTENNVPQGKAIASGWGAVDIGGQTTNDLLKVVLEIFNNEKCNYTYRNAISYQLKYGIVEHLMVCAGSTAELRDSCQGDSGGPLQVYHNETEEVKCMYDIIGVISFGKQCLRKDVPGVHTRVSTYIKWIEDIVWPN